MLAGDPIPRASEWAPMFTRAMAELSIEIPPESEAGSVVAREIAQIILNQEVDPRDGAQAMWDLLHGIEEMSPRVTVFEELAWALDSGPDHKPFSDLTRHEVEQRVVEEARQLLRAMPHAL